MASFAISGDEEQTKPEISYDFIESEDSDAVLDLLKRTFFKVLKVFHVKQQQPCALKFWLRKEKKLFLFNSLAHFLSNLIPPLVRPSTSSHNVIYEQLSIRLLPDEYRDPMLRSPPHTLFIRLGFLELMPLWRSFDGGKCEPINYFYRNLELFGVATITDICWAKVSFSLHMRTRKRTNKRIFDPIMFTNISLRINDAGKVLLCWNDTRVD